MNPLQPAGSTPASAWSIPDPAAPIRAAAVLAPELDQATGRRLSLDGQGDPVMNAVALQFRTTRGSGVAVEEDGTALFEIQKQTEDAPALIGFEVARVLRPFVDAGVITAEPPDVTAGPDAGNVATILQRVHRGDPGVRRGGAEPTEAR